jgi:hypothetical protein
MLHTCLPSGEFLFETKMNFQNDACFVCENLDFFLGCSSKVVKKIFVSLKTMFYLSSALSHIHPILSLRYLKFG